MPNIDLFDKEKEQRDKLRTSDPATQYMLDYVEGLGMDTVFTRQKEI